MQVPNILLPVQVAALVGPNGEGAALGLVNMLIQLSGFTQPFIGAWSDRSQSRWGRRRPFILFGQIGVLVSLYMMMVAEDMAMLSLGNFLFSALNNVPTTVYAAVIPELVAPEQRGLASGFQNLMMLSGGLVGNGIGYLTGIGAVSQSAACVFRSTVLCIQAVAAHWKRVSQLLCNHSRCCQCIEHVNNHRM